VDLDAHGRTDGCARMAGRRTAGPAAPSPPTPRGRGPPTGRRFPSLPTSPRDPPTLGAVSVAELWPAARHPRRRRTRASCSSTCTCPMRGASRGPTAHLTYLDPDAHRRLRRRRPRPARGPSTAGATT
jgi:hypothetical protein